MTAASPEELDALLEDAALLGDGAALAELLAADAVLVGPGWVGGPGRALDLLAGHVANGGAQRVGDVAVTVDTDVVVVSRRDRHGWHGVAVVHRSG